ncbi:MAG: radical SAM protein [Methanobacteriota archaeon]|nr:MAG: radical SAM protein [Euryarchaeota archaeon]
MKVVASYGKDDLAKVYVAQMRNDPRYLVEFVESLQPPVPREEKWVLILSSSFGCQMRCLMCDAGGEYHGKLTEEEILSQVDYMIRSRFPDGNVPIPKFKVQFARMGEPSLNPAVLGVLRKLPTVYDAPGMMPCISTIAPNGGKDFFGELTDIKNEFYPNGMFQMQFSIHSTDDQKRNQLMPGKKWGFEDISRFGEEFYQDGDRMVTLNFAMARDYPVDTSVVREYFDPSIFFIKLTPLNPTQSVARNELQSAIDPYVLETSEKTVNDFKSQGFDVLLSIGELEENSIGSNCGQFVSVLRDSGYAIREGYQSGSYQIDQ